MNKGELAALIGVRGGSKRVKNKNSRPFAGSNLLTIKIKQLLNVESIDRVIVNSEDTSLLEIAEQAGAEVVLRDDHFATDSISTSDYYYHIAESCDAEFILSATVTTPLVKTNSFVLGISKFWEKCVNNKTFNSVTSTRRVKEFLYQDGSPLNYDPENQVRSQDLPQIHAISYGFSIISREDMMTGKNIVGKRPLFIPLGAAECQDIDDQDDFDIAETLFESGQFGDDKIRSH